MAASYAGTQPADLSDGYYSYVQFFTRLFPSVYRDKVPLCL